MAPKTCRTCQEETTSKNSIKLDENAPIKAKLAMCVPNIDLDLVPDAVICHTCVNALHSEVIFKCRCMLTEQDSKTRQESIQKTQLAKYASPKRFKPNSTISSSDDELIETKKQSLVKKPVVKKVDVIKFCTENKIDYRINNCATKMITSQKLSQESCDGFQNCNKPVDEIETINIDDDDDSTCVLSPSPESSSSQSDASVKKPTNPTVPGQSIPSYDLYIQGCNCTNHQVLSCKLCLYKTDYQNAMIYHNKVHESERNSLLCELCPYRALSKLTLRKHRMKEHTAKKAYVPNKRVTKCNMMRHEDEKDKPFGCDQCGFRYYYKRGLKRHLLKHVN